MGIKDFSVSLFYNCAYLRFPFLQKIFHNTFTSMLIINLIQLYLYYKKTYWRCCCFLAHRKQQHLQQNFPHVSCILKMNSRHACFCIITLIQLGHILSDQSMWKLEITLADTTTTVIAT